MKLRAGIVALLALALVAGASFALSGAVFTSGSSNAGNSFRAGDWTGPSVALGDPGTPLRGTVPLSATASDEFGTVTAIRIQRGAAGSGSWVELCTRASSPASCAWDTTLAADGPYDLRAIATDNSGNSTTSSLVSARVVDNTPPTVAMVDPGSFLRGTVGLQATAGDATSGVASVAIQRAPSGSGNWTTICVASGPYACMLDTRSGATPDGEYDFRALATDAAGNTAFDATSATVDNTSPTVSLTVPGSPLRGVVTFSSSPADAGSTASGVAEVSIQIAVAGSGNWTSTACTATASPWSCTWNSSAFPNGSYDFRAVVTDLAGNSGTSSTVSRTVDNTVSSIYMNDPGAYLSGAVTLQATVTNPAASPSVRIQIAPSGTGSWTTLCTLTASPWSCSFDTGSRADGMYDFRAVLTDASGTKNSNVVSSRIDNTLLRGIDVQSANKSGGTAGRFEAGDTLALTYNEAVAPGSLAGGWDGSAPLTVYIRLRDGGLLTPKLSGKDDTIDVFTNAALTSPVNLGSVNTKTDLIGGGKVAVFTGTLTRSASGTTMTLTVGTLASGGGIRTASDKVLMIWTPASAARDLANNSCSTAPVTQTGSNHLNF